MKGYTPIDDPGPGEDIWKKVGRWLFIWFVLPIGIGLIFGPPYYKRVQKKAKEYVPPERYHLIYDPTRSSADIGRAEVRGDTLEYIYRDDPRLTPKRAPEASPRPSYDHIDLSDPAVVEQIFETADFWDLYERYAD